MHRWALLHNLYPIVVINRQCLTWVIWVPHQLLHQGLLDLPLVTLGDMVGRMLQQEVAVVVDLLEVDINVDIRLHYLKPRKLPNWPNRSVHHLVSNFLFLVLVEPRRQMLNELKARLVKIEMDKVKVLEIILGPAYVVGEALVMDVVKAWQSVLIPEADRACVVGEAFNSLPCKLPQMLAQEVKLKLKAMISKDVVVLQAVIIETRQEISKEIGETNHLKHNNQIRKDKWVIFKVNNSNKEISNQAIVIGGPSINP